MGLRISVRSCWPEADASTFTYEFAQARVAIGRSRSADVQLPHAAVSGAHATIHAQGAGYAIVDENSTNGTRVNGVPITPGRFKTLRSNDVVDLGGFRLVIEVGVPVVTTISARLTTAFAEQMLREDRGADPAPHIETRLLAVMEAPDQHVDLLPLPQHGASGSPPEIGDEPSHSRASAAPLEPPAARLARLERGEIAVYALAALLVATSAFAMALLIRA